MVNQARIDHGVLEAEVPPPEKKSFKFKVTIFMICLICIVVAMDAVIVAATLPAITVALSGSSLEAFWVGTSYLLAQTVTIPIYGTISDIFGRKWVMVTATSIFLFGSILCATAQNMDWLIAARVVQGLGGGGCLTLTTIIVSDMTTLRERPMFLAFSAFSWALGTNIGVPVGGAIGQYTSWRWIFWINIPLCVLALAGILYALQLHQDVSSLKSKLARIDYLGILVFIGASTFLLFGLTSGGVMNPWDSPTTLAPLGIGIAGLGVFVIVEWKFACEPMIPLRIFHDRTANSGYIGAFIHGLVLWAFAYYLIIFFLGARQHTLFLASAETLPGSAPVALSAVLCSVIVSMTLRFQKLTWIAWIILCGGTALNILMKPDSNAGILFATRVIPAIGGGFLFQLPLYAVQASTSDDDQGIATATVTLMRSFGQAFGVAIGGTVFQNEFDSFTNRAIREGTIPAVMKITGAQAAGSYDVIKLMPEVVQVAYELVYSNSLEVLWYVMTGIAGTRKPGKASNPDRDAAVQFIAGAVAGYKANGNKNGWDVADPSNSKAADDVFDFGIRAPGVVRIPVCSEEEAFNNWSKYDNCTNTGMSKNYPCN
ncbi:hypothetical protein V490_08662 [Pseudogymnoascus sp. VKM F-3557]|nr:hypothetical protein V490_08662 [Pseudogymnoascus sp. VKM F-3557]